MEELKVGICGWGNVATGLFSALENNADIIASNSGAQFTVSVIGARRDNPKCDPGNTPIERDIFDVISHDIDVVVELIGGVEVARELIIKAIKNKKHVVTANKALFAVTTCFLFLIALIISSLATSTPPISSTTTSIS